MDTLKQTVEFIVQAAEREGSLHSIDLCSSKRRFRDSITDYSDLNGKQFFWYNSADNSTHVISKSTK